MFLALCLHHNNISCVVLEKRSEPRPGSRSLGIHPVSLELLEKIELADQLIDAGIKISKGIAYVNRDKIGEISFESCPPPYNFILSLPQHQTEKILNNETEKISRSLLLRSAEVRAVNQTQEQVGVTFEYEGKLQHLSGSFLVGCDGKHSLIRRQTGIAFNGKSYPDTYIMGDFSDNTSLGKDAAVYLCDNGLIESFPLTEGRRRWVVKTEKYLSNINRTDIEHRIYKRIGHQLHSTQNFMLSSFGVQKYVANPMVKNRLILAGDAAHIVSPIGGQGMNLGWLDAWDLAHTLSLILQNGMDSNKALRKYESRRLKAVKNTTRRAELNMRLGRKSRYPRIKKNIIRLMTNTLLEHFMARLFTMRGVESWIF